MIGQLFNLIGASITFVRENDRKTTIQAVMSRDAHPLLQFIKYGVCGVVAFSTHQIVAISLGMTVILDGEFALKLQNSDASPPASGGHEIVLARGEGNELRAVSLSHKFGAVSADFTKSDSAAIARLGQLATPHWESAGAIPAEEKRALLDAAESVLEVSRKSIREKHSIINNTLAFLVASVVAYVLNVLIVFTPGRHAKWVEIALFLGVGGVSYIGGILAVKLVFDLFGSGPLLSVFASFGFAVASALVNFVCRKFIIFAK